jgi:hypothetical protein
MRNLGETHRAEYIYTLTELHCIAEHELYPSSIYSEYDLGHNGIP